MCELRPLHDAGLCRDCQHGPTCTFPRDPAQPVRSCDEFSGLGPARGRNDRLRMRKQTTFQANVALATPYLKGLCLQCSCRPTCTFPKPLGGVWHCDELA